MVGVMPARWDGCCANEGERRILLRTTSDVFRTRIRSWLPCLWQPECEFIPFTTTMQRVHIEVQNQFGGWQHVQTMHHQANAYRTAQQRARSSGKRYRLVDDEGHLLDLIEP